MVFGGPLATVGLETVRYYPSDEFHSHSDVYDDLGQTREWHFNDTRLNATDEEPGGLVFLGTHRGDGLAWYEIVAEGNSTLRWRIHEGAVSVEQSPFHNQIPNYHPITDQSTPTHR